MSVLIKGMDMPKCCLSCLFHHETYLLSRHICVANKSKEIHVNLDTGFPDDCPLVEIKAPHGDLIERIPTIIKIQEIEEEPQYQHDGEDWINGLIQAEEVVRYAPTVIEAEGNNED